MRPLLDRELQRLRADTLHLGSKVELAIGLAVTALVGAKGEHARQVIAEHRTVHPIRQELESRCLKLIATQQPMARDVRLLFAVMEIGAEIGRIGDYAQGVARIALQLGGLGPVLVPDELSVMARLARRMLRNALQAFADEDADLAHQVAHLDDVVDAHYRQIYQKLIGRVPGGTGQVDHSHQLMWAAHNLERAADRAVNICERVIFSVTGRSFQLDGFDDAVNAPQSMG